MNPAGPLDLQHAVMRAADLSRSELVVLMVLLDRADASGQCFPSATLMARQARYSKRVVHQTLDRLRTRGLITWRAGVGRGNTNQYHLVVPAILALKPIAKGDATSLIQEKGDAGSPLPQEKVTLATQKGDVSDTKGLPEVTQKEAIEGGHIKNAPKPPKRAKQAIRTARGTDYDAGVLGGGHVR